LSEEALAKGLKTITTGIVYKKGLKNITTGIVYCFAGTGFSLGVPLFYQVSDRFAPIRSFPDPLY